MKFKITKGLSLISIGMSDIGSYFSYKAPLSFSWYDCAGSLAKYLCIFPDKNNFRETVRNKIQMNLNKDFTNDKDSLFELLEPILSLFENGEYSLSFCNSENRQFFYYRTSFDNFEKKHLKSFYIEFAIEKDENFKPDKNLRIDSYTYNYYDLNSICFIATEPKSNINWDRVKYFEEEIKKGKRPFAIIFSSDFISKTSEADWISEYFILDGHHKLIAYSNLKIYPAIALITKINNSEFDLKFDFEALKKRLYPSQSNHVFENWEEKDFYKNGIRISEEE
ncbi:hypothetical protein [Aureivirga sp. CE67]|uniref:hypothetical protein n=1 Tax=Aureivirga sp. CE67 TaxID=1788983 RepID=UPI0018C91AD5|nr:hypothetical protein [Aureivirga sp. CE67]